MPTMPPAVVPFWRDFCAAVGEDHTDRFFEAFHFDDNAASANALAAFKSTASGGAGSGVLSNVPSSGSSGPNGSTTNL